VRRLLRFAVVGAVGFVIDAGVYLALQAAGLTPLPSRIASIAVALAFTFAANRRFTFAEPGWPSAGRFVAYAVVSGVGATTNLAAFWIAISIMPRLPHVLAIGLGSLAGLLVNFTGSRHFVFASRPHLAASTPRGEGRSG
jgi:putative flippase GtrA